jgi:hypothetical protein
MDLYCLSIALQVPWRSREMPPACVLHQRTDGQEVLYRVPSGQYLSQGPAQLLPLPEELLPLPEETAGVETWPVSVRSRTY